MNATQIREIRNNLGISQENIAHKLGVSLSTFNRWEKGLSKPSPLALEKLKELAGKDERN